jgi:hypothetical protein
LVALLALTLLPGLLLARLLGLLARALATTLLPAGRMAATLLLAGPLPICLLFLLALLVLELVGILVRHRRSPGTPPPAPR